MESPIGNATCPMSADLRLAYASIGKAFTRAAIGQLIAAGRVKLTDTLGKLPARLSQCRREAGDGRTAPRLSGRDRGLFRGRVRPCRQVAVSGQPRLLRSSRPSRSHSCRASTLYCNGCYIVLGEIIAKVAGLPYGYVEERVFKPAGMKTAGFLTAADANVAPGYTRASPSSPWTSAASRNIPLAAARRRIVRRRSRSARVRHRVAHAPSSTRGRPRGFSSEAAAGPRALARYAIAGGAPGANTSLESGAGWTIGLARQPRSAERLARRTHARHRSVSRPAVGEFTCRLLRRRASAGAARLTRVPRPAYRRRCC